ncbi:MAG: Glu/Leu/Phe/Val dehydrogenase dimerization domain-containing protein [Desulfobacterales bacterium]
MNDLSPHPEAFDASHDDLFTYAESLGYGELHLKMDPKTGLRAIIAIHDLTLGPAVGGCRCMHYDSTQEAIRDALRLAQMMTYKAAISGLPHGGGKSVLIQPDVIRDRQAYFNAFGEFVDSLNGRYITAMDSGTCTDDMDAIAQKTSYVTCAENHFNQDGDPSPFTARGVLRGIEAAVKHKLGRKDIEGIRVVVQGVGHVGYNLVKGLQERGVRVTVCDTDDGLVRKCVHDFKVQSIAPEAVYETDCDVFAPCALGAVLSRTNIEKIKAPIIAGGANNQLAQPEDGEFIHQRGILYAPDFVINAGGLMRVAYTYDGESLEKINEEVEHIHDTLLNIFERSAREDLPTSKIAEILALERLK